MKKPPTHHVATMAAATSSDSKSWGKRCSEMPSLPTSTTAKRMINARGLKQPVRAAATQEYPARRMKIVVEITKAPYEIGVTRLFIVSKVAERKGQRRSQPPLSAD